MCPIALEDLLHTAGEDNTGGIQTGISWAFLEDIETLPDPEVDDSAGDGTFSNLMTISSNVVMKAGKKIKSCYVTLEKGSIEGDSQGEYDGMSFMNKLKFYFPGQSAVALGFSQVVKNANIIFWVPELDGQIRQVGHRGYPAKMVSAPSTTGNKSSDAKGTMFEFHSARKGPALIFTGEIEESDVVDVEEPEIPINAILDDDGTLELDDDGTVELDN